MNANSSSGSSSCVFCDIVKADDKSKIIFEDDEVVVFPDIKPAAPHHYLVVPKNHMLNAKHLEAQHKPLVQKMVDVGHKVLQDKGCDIINSRCGFHWPPFTSIDHLHLHVIAPESEMGFIGKLVFKMNSWWFVSPNYVISRL